MYALRQKTKTQKNSHPQTQKASKGITPFEETRHALVSFWMQPILRTVLKLFARRGRF